MQVATSRRGEAEAFFSGDAFLEKPNGSYRLSGTGWGRASKVGK